MPPALALQQHAPGASSSQRGLKRRAQAAQARQCEWATPLPTGRIKVLRRYLVRQGLRASSARSLSAVRCPLPSHALLIPSSLPGAHCPVLTFFPRSLHLHIPPQASCRLPIHLALSVSLSSLAPAFLPSLFPSPLFSPLLLPLPSSFCFLPQPLCWLRFFFFSCHCDFKKHPFLFRCLVLCSFLPRRIRPVARNVAAILFVCSDVVCDFRAPRLQKGRP